MHRNCNIKKIRRHTLDLAFGLNFDLKKEKKNTINLVRLYLTVTCKPFGGHLIEFPKCPRIRPLFDAYRWCYLNSIKIKNPVNTEIYGVLVRFDV